MSSVQLSDAGVAAVAFTKKGLVSFDGLRVSPPSALRVCSSRRSFRSLVVKVATVVTPKYTSLKPLEDRVLVKLSSAEEKTIGGILLPSTAQSKPQGGEVVAVGEGRTIGDKKVEVSIQTGATRRYALAALRARRRKNLFIDPPGFAFFQRSSNESDEWDAAREYFRFMATGPSDEELLAWVLRAEPEEFAPPGYRDYP